MNARITISITPTTHITFSIGPDGGLQEQGGIQLGRVRAEAVNQARIFAARMLSQEANLAEVEATVADVAERLLPAALLEAIRSGTSHAAAQKVRAVHVALATVRARLREPSQGTTA